MGLVASLTTFGAVDAVFVVFLAVAALAVVAFFVVAFAATTAFLTVATAAATGVAAIILLAPAVGVFVQYHVSSASAHALPSDAVPYGSLWESIAPLVSSSVACPLVLLILSAVCEAAKAVKLYAPSTVPSGNT